MTSDEGRILFLIADRLGRAQAISAADLARVTGLSDRAVRRIVKALIEVHGCPIASSPHPPAGYYVPVADAEVRDTLESLRGRALSILTRMSRLKRTTLQATIDQLLLGITEDAA